MKTQVASEGLANTRAAIAQAALDCGRKTDAVRLVAVSKYHALERIEAAYAQGQRDFGENYAQELADKAQRLASKGLSPTWHFIGQLQRNKVKTVVAWAHVIHSVDSLRLAQAISRAVCARAADATSKPAPIGILLQVNFDDEAQKGGVRPSEVVGLCQAIVELPGVALWGLMAVPPDTRSQAADADAAPAAHYFKALARLGDAVSEACPGRYGGHLSMGMSHDFASAIGEGATLVRIGTAIFGPRPRHRSAP